MDRSACKYISDRKENKMVTSYGTLFIHFVIKIKQYFYDKVKQVSTWIQLVTVQIQKVNYILYYDFLSNITWTFNNKKLTIRIGL